MQKIFVVLFAALLMLPSAVLAQESHPASTVVIEPWITEEEAISIAESWGISVRNAELVYEDGMNIWKVYGTYTAYIGPAKVRLNAIVKLDANTGEFVGLEMKRSSDTYNREKAIERLKSLGISVENLEIVRDYTPYWQAYGYAKMNLAGFDLKIPVYVSMDARTLEIWEIRSEPWYHIMPVEAVLSENPKPFWQGMAEAVGIAPRSAPQDFVAEGNLNKDNAIESGFEYDVDGSEVEVLE